MEPRAATPAAGRVEMDAAAWDARYEATGGEGRTMPNRFVVEHLAGLQPGTALDLGAGAGRNAVWLAGRGWQVRAVDFSAVALELARRAASAAGVDIETEVADVTAYEPDPPEWDLVLLAYLQLPTAGRLDVLRRASRGLAPGGRLLVVAHDRANIDDGYGGPRSPEVSYAPAETVDALDGLDVRFAATVQRPVAADGGEWVALDTVVVAERATAT